jgi:hypothetical protein
LIFGRCARFLRTTASSLGWLAPRAGCWDLVVVALDLTATSPSWGECGGRAVDQCLKAVFEGVFAGRPAALASGLRASAVVAVLLVEGAIRPGYDPLHHFGSGLSLGSGGWVQTTNFLITGMLVVGFASGLRRALGSGRGSVAAPILTGVFGVTLIVAGSFPTDPTPGYPPRTAGTTEAITVPGMIHQAAAAFTAGTQS